MYLCKTILRIHFLGHYGHEYRLHPCMQVQNGWVDSLRRQVNQAIGQLHCKVSSNLMDSLSSSLVLYESMNWQEKNNHLYLPQICGD